MAVVTAVIQDPLADGQALEALWETITSGDSGSAVEDSEYADRSVQCTGTWDSETITIQGSNDGAIWATLNDLQGNALSFTANGLKGIAEATRYIRPLGDGGGGTVDIDVTLFGRNTK